MAKKITHFFKKKGGSVVRLAFFFTMDENKRTQFNGDNIELRSPLTMAVIWLVAETVDVLNITAENLESKPFVPLTQPYVSECIRCILYMLLKIIAVNPTVLDLINFRGSTKGKLSDNIKRLLQKYEDMVPSSTDLESAVAGRRIRVEPFSLLAHDKTFVQSAPFSQQLWFAPRSVVPVSLSLFDDANSETELSVLYFIVTLVLGDHVGDESILVDTELASSIAHTFSVECQNNSNVVAVIISKVVASWLWGVVKHHTCACGKYWSQNQPRNTPTNPERNKSVISNDMKKMCATYRKFCYNPLLARDAIAVRNCLWKLFTAYDVHLVDYMPYSVQRYGTPGLQFDKVTVMFTAPQDVQAEYCQIVQINISDLPATDMASLDTFKYPSRTKMSRIVANFENSHPLFLAKNSSEKNKAFHFWRSEEVVTMKRKMDDSSAGELSLSPKKKKVLNIDDYVDLLKTEASKPDKVDWFIDETFAWEPLAKDTIKSIADSVMQCSMCMTTKRLVQLVCALPDDEKFVSQIEDVPLDSWMPEQDALNLEMNCAECTDRKALVMCVRTLLQRRIIVATAQFKLARDIVIAEQEKLVSQKRQLEQDYVNKLQILEAKQREIDSKTDTNFIPFLQNELYSNEYGYCESDYTTY